MSRPKDCSVKVGEQVQADKTSNEVPIAKSAKSDASALLLVRELRVRDDMSTRKFSLHDGFHVKSTARLG